MAVVKAADVAQTPDDVEASRIAVVNAAVVEHVQLAAAASEPVKDAAVEQMPEADAEKAPAKVSVAPRTRTIDRLGDTAYLKAMRPPGSLAMLRDAVAL